MSHPTPALAYRPTRRWNTTLDGQRLRQLRRAYGLTQAQLAQRAGLSPTTVTRLEARAHSRCRGRTLARLATVLGETPAALIPDQCANS